MLLIAVFILNAQFFNGQAECFSDLTSSPIIGVNKLQNVRIQWQALNVHTLIGHNGVECPVPSSGVIKLLSDIFLTVWT